jgi:enhancing lycopene biosynthesis protein 2
MLRKIIKSNERLLGNHLYFVNTSSKASLSTDQKRVAMIIPGCGVFDGAEIVETTSAMIHLSRQNVNLSFFAPNIDQMHVVNHYNGSIEPEKRNVLVEAARITRGNIKPIEKLNSSNFDALIIPGGFGAAKNFCDYAIQQKKSLTTVNKEVERVIRDFLISTKPIGLCCIAPVLMAKLLPHCKLTVGKSGDTNQWPYSDNINELRLMNAQIIEKDVDEFCVDEVNKIVTTPAFMKNAQYHQVYDGIGKMVNEVIKLCNK